MDPITKETLENGAVAAEAPNRFAALVTEKMRAGIDREMAEQLARRQIERDKSIAEEEAKKATSEEKPKKTAKA